MERTDLPDVFDRKCDLYPVFPVCSWILRPDGVGNGVRSGQGSDRLPQAGDDRVYCGKCSQLRKCIVCRAGKAMLHLYDGLFENNSYNHRRFVFHSCVWGERRRHFQHFRKYDMCCMVSDCRIQRTVACGFFSV